MDVIDERWDFEEQEDGVGNPLYSYFIFGDGPDARTVAVDIQDEDVARQICDFHNDHLDKEKKEDHSIDGEWEVVTPEITSWGYGVRVKDAGIPGQIPGGEVMFHGLSEEVARRVVEDHNHQVKHECSKEQMQELLKQAVLRKCMTTCDDCEDQCDPYKEVFKIKRKDDRIRGQHRLGAILDDASFDGHKGKG
jgi:hypothetical protein